MTSPTTRSLQAEGKADQATANAKQAAGKVSDAAQDAADAGDLTVAGSSTAHRVGLKSEYAYIGGFASIGLVAQLWFLSRNKTGDDKAQSDRWGIFIGHWAPTFMALGVALKLEED